MEWETWNRTKSLSLEIENIFQESKIRLKSRYQQSIFDKNFDFKNFLPTRQIFKMKIPIFLLFLAILSLWMGTQVEAKQWVSWSLLDCLILISSDSAQNLLKSANQIKLEYSGSLNIYWVRKSQKSCMNSRKFILFILLCGWSQISSR